MTGIDKGIRAVNYLIDIICVALISILIFMVFPEINYSFSFYTIVFVYYSVMEISMQQTLGKMFTKTIVVNKYGQKPHFTLILMRSFLRLMPWDALSYLFGTEQGFHDKLSLTKLVYNKKNLVNINQSN